MFDLIKNAYVGKELLPSLSCEIKSESGSVAAKGFLVNQVHYFNESLLEEAKIEIANYLKSIGINEYCAEANSFLASINTIEDLEDLDVLIAAITAAGFIQNSHADIFHNLEAIGESKFHYLTTCAIEYAKKNNDLDSERQFVQKMQAILSRTRFFINKENIEKYASKQK